MNSRIKLEVAVFLDLPAFHSDEAFAERGCFPIRTIDRRIERQLGGGHLARRTYLLRRLFDQAADLGDRWDRA